MKLKVTAHNGARSNSYGFKKSWIEFGESTVPGVWREGQGSADDDKGHQALSTFLFLFPEEPALICDTIGLAT